MGNQEVSREAAERMVRTDIWLTFALSIDTIGVHYSGTLWRWYRNWLGNAETIKAKYGQRWYRIWELFLAWSTIASRQGSATCYQMVVVKNLNATHRINVVTTQNNHTDTQTAARAAGKAILQQ